MGVYPTGVYFMGMHLMGVYLMGVHLMSVYLMGMYLMGVHLMSVYLMGHVCYSFLPLLAIDKIGWTIVENKSAGTCLARFSCALADMLCLAIL
jgi:hypothetical protein